jgi:hypothetical protein
MMDNTTPPLAAIPRQFHLSGALPKKLPSLQVYSPQRAQQGITFPGVTPNHFTSVYAREVKPLIFDG